MKITRCKYGHYYDKAYFAECPHCCRARGGRDEDIILIKNESQDKNISQKERDKRNVERWIGEAWDELEGILNEEEDNSTKKVYEEKEQKKDITVEKYENSGQCLESFMIFATMPVKVIKNQEFCMDFCLFKEKEWETGAKMLTFKSQESIRDLKPVKISLPVNAMLRILYKDEEIFSKKIEMDRECESVFCTFPVTVTDTRDRRFHMVKAVFEIKEQNIEIPLYLMPNP